MSTPHEILKEYWGFDTFKNPQEKIINAVLEHKNIIALLPTGGGKSICFQVPALLKPGTCIVISPLIALMNDQVSNLKNKGIKATTIPSGSTEDEIIQLFDNIRFGKYKFLYVSPERLQSKFIQQKIAQLEVNLIAIDEAHCISEWGHDFRPSYKQLSILKEIHPDVNSIALTATATSKVIQDIENTLSFENTITFKKSFERKNLAYQVYFTEDKLLRLEQIFTKTKAPSIVYVNSRNKTKELSSYLNTKGFSSNFYHAGLSSAEKNEIFDNWMQEKVQIIVATNAFGMGIDKDNVKIVIHYDIPNSIENYVQEAGRAGRNGEKAFAVLLTNETDIALKKELHEKTNPSIKEIKFIHQKLYQYYQIAIGESITDVFEFNISKFCTTYELPKNKTFNTLQILNNNGIVKFNPNSQQKSSFRFLVSSSKMINYKQSFPKQKVFIENLLRLYNGFSEQFIKIDEYFLAKKSGITSRQVIKNLERMADDNVIEYKKSISDAQLTFLVPREDDKTINRHQKTIKNYLKQKTIKIDSLISFVSNNELCRNIQLLSYFGENNAKKCGTCDVCLAKKTKSKNISTEILKILELGEMSVQEISSQLNTSTNNILINLRYLLSEEKISLTAYNKYKLNS